MIKSVNMGSKTLPFQVINIFLFYICIYIFITEITGNDFLSHQHRMSCRRRSKILEVFRIFSHFYPFWLARSPDLILWIFIYGNILKHV